MPVASGRPLEVESSLIPSGPSARTIEANRSSVRATDRTVGWLPTGASPGTPATRGGPATSVGGGPATS